MSSQVFVIYLQRMALMLSDVESDILGPLEDEPSPQLSTHHRYLDCVAMSRRLPRSMWTDVIEYFSASVKSENTEV